MKIKYSIIFKRSTLSLSLSLALLSHKNFTVVQINISNGNEYQRLDLLTYIYHFFFSVHDTELETNTELCTHSNR